MAVLDRMKKAWNAFTNEERVTATNDYSSGTVVYSSSPPSRPRLRVYNERSIISAIYNRIAIDVASVVIRHVKLDDSGRYSDDMDSSFQRCLTLEPNLDQGPRAFRQDIVMTLFDGGVSAIVPVDTAKNPQTNELVDIYSLRVGTIVAWYANSVRVSLWNEAKGSRQEVTLNKSAVAIVENPLYSVMNESNSTLQRLIRKLGLLDQVDEATSSGKLDMIIQLPYTIKTEARRDQARARTQEIEFQLKGSQYGIAYADATEKITQLNRPIENNLLKQIEYLAAMLYGQLGITEDVMNGTADEATMLNYWNRTIEPIVESIVEAMRRAFIGEVGLKKKQDILYFKDPFKLVPVGQIAEITDKFTRNEVLSSNEIRGFLGIRPSTDPKADQLVNSNMPQPEGGAVAPAAPAASPAVDELMSEMDQLMKDTFDDLEAQVEELSKQLADGE
jgi:hypothetical protein